MEYKALMLPAYLKERLKDRAQEKNVSQIDLVEKYLDEDMVK